MNVRVRACARSHRMQTLCAHCRLMIAFTQFQPPFNRNLRRFPAIDTIATMMMTELRLLKQSPITQNKRPSSRPHIECNGSCVSEVLQMNGHLRASRFPCMHASLAVNEAHTQFLRSPFHTATAHNFCFRCIPLLP